MSYFCKYFFLFTAFLAVVACSKTSDNIIWQKSLGEGEAFFACPAGDTGLFCGGNLAGKPYLVLLDSRHEKRFEYVPEAGETFTSGLVSDGYILAAGTEGGNLVLVSPGIDGLPVWDSTFEFGFRVERVSLIRKGPGHYLAVASRSADSVATGNYGLAFIEFTGDGEIISSDDTIFYSIHSVSGAAVDKAGNIYLAGTKQGAGGKTKAVVISYDERFRFLWERELYNNPEYSASCMAVTVDDDENIYTSGFAELPASKGNIRNAFATSLTRSGTIRWKRYLEYNNRSTSITITRAGRLYVLNSGCLILNTLNTADGTVTGILRVFASCDPSYDRAEGNSVSEAFDDIIVIAGVKNGSFYIAAKSPDSFSPL